MQSSQTIHAWERLGWVWSVIFHMALLMPFGFWLLWRSTGGPQLVSATLLVVTALIAHWLFVYGLPRRGVAVRQNLWLGLGYVAVLIGVTFGLLAIHDVYFFVLSGLFSQLFYFLPMQWAVPVSLLLMPVLAARSSGLASLAEVLVNPVTWIWLLGGVCGSLVALWISAIIRQGHQQHELIEELRRTQAELAASERHAGVLAERQRLAREIHDTLAQGFISVVTHLEAADQVLESDTSTARRHMQQATATARESLGQARRVVQDLRPEVLEGGTLADAIRREGEKWSERTGIGVSLKVTGAALPLHPQSEVALLRAAQECLANVHRHAGAGQVNVTLSYMPDRVLLDVQDDGGGFAPGKSGAAGGDGGGFGLIAMRQRVEALGGSLLVESNPGEGATVVVEIPRHGE